jgi:hypothetical protein
VKNAILHVQALHVSVDCRFSIRLMFTGTLASGSSSPTRNASKRPFQSPIVPEQRKKFKGLGINSNSLDAFLLKPNSTTWIRQFEQKLLKATISNDWSFRWIENVESKELLNFLKPTLSTAKTQLPSRHTLAGRILDEAVFDVSNRQEDYAKDPNGVTLTFDGWKNVRKQNIMGVVLVNSIGKTIIWDAMDVSAHREKYQDVIHKVESILQDPRIHGVTVRAVITDCAPAYQAARVRLRRDHRKIVWLPCFAHQMNLCVADVLRSFPALNCSLQTGIKITEFFNRSTFFLAKLRDKQKALLGKYVSLAKPCDTRWNSFHRCAESFLQSKAALQVCS